VRTEFLQFTRKPRLPYAPRLHDGSPNPIVLKCCDHGLGFVRPFWDTFPNADEVNFFRILKPLTRLRDRTDGSYLQVA
jgi:hypothetical protein